jgi:hypothetical protein
MQEGTEDRMFFKTKKPADREVPRLANLQTRYVNVRRRELANIIMGSDIEVFEAAFHHMRIWEGEMVAADPKRISAEYAAILAQFPDFEDFDLLGLRHCVPYSERTEDIYSLGEHYKCLSKFLVMDGLLDQIGRKAHPLKKTVYDEHEDKCFYDTSRRAKDLRLAHEIKEAIDRYYAYCRGRDSCMFRMQRHHHP